MLSWWSRLRAGAAPVGTGPGDPSDPSGQGSPGGAVVFVSYAHEDETRVRQLVDDLDRGGLPTWFAPRQIRLGHSIDAAVAQEIEAARFVLVAGSKAATGSAWVGREVAYALECESRAGAPRVIPVYLESDDVPLALRGRLAADLRAEAYGAASGI